MRIFLNPKFVQIDDITFSFSICNGLQSVKGLNHNAIFNLSDQHLLGLLSPVLSNNLRKFGLEAVVNGRNTEEDKNFIMDVIDLVEVSRSLSHKQFLPDYDKAIVASGLQELNLRSEKSQRFKEIILKAFKDQNIPVTINYIYDFNAMLGIGDTNYTEVLKACNNNIDYLTKISYYHPHDKYSNVSDWFYGKFILTVIGAISNDSNEVKISKNLRSLRYHVEESKKFFKDTEDLKLVVELVDKAQSIAKNKLYKISLLKSKSSNKGEVTC